MSPILEPQSEDFSWAVVFRNSIASAKYVAIVIPIAIFVIELPTITEKEPKWFFEFLLVLPVSLFALMFILFVMMLPLNWWWNFRWATEKRRRHLTKASIIVALYAPLLVPSVHNYLFNGPNDNPVIAVIILYSLLGYFLAAPVGVFLGWVCLEFIRALKPHVKIAESIFNYFHP